MEDRNFQKRRIVKRRGMEGAEVRRLHILYFLSLNGRDEHPHLIRIHHLSKNGVRLRDIKRWLGELRGKDMPDSFAWSYKRRYRTDYVWQDILDDDLVTPISDNEYFLKGSHISSTNHNNMDFSPTPMQKEQESAEVNQTTSSKDTGNNLYSSNPSNYVSTSSSSSSSSIQDSSPTFGSETPTSTDDSTADGLQNNPNGIKLEASSPASKSIILLKKRKTNKAEMVINGKSRSSSYNTAAPSNKPHHRKSHSGGSIFQSLITCGGGGVETNDSVVTISNKRYKPLLKMCSCNSTDVVRDSVKEKGEHRQHGATRAAYRPLYGPNCSQCGKTFKPEKLHSHMSSCKGMKALTKKSKASTNEDSGSAYILAQNC